MWWMCTPPTTLSFSEPRPARMERTMIRVTANAVAHAAVVASRLVEAPVIAAISDSGGAARLLSEYRPEAIVVGMTRLPEVYSQLAAYWGVLPMITPDANSDILIMC